MKKSEIWELREVGICIWATFNLLVFKWVIRCTFLKICRNLKMADRRVKQTEIWDSGASCYIGIWVTIDLLVSKVIFGSFSALAM